MQTNMFSHFHVPRVDTFMFVLVFASRLSVRNSIVRFQSTKGSVRGHVLSVSEYALATSSALNAAAVSHREYATFRLLTLRSSMISPNYLGIKYKHIPRSVYPYNPRTIILRGQFWSTRLVDLHGEPIRRLTFIDNPIKFQPTANIQVKSRRQLIPGYVRYLPACGRALTSKDDQ